MFEFGQTTTPAFVTSSTKFDDLPGTLKTSFAELENYIKKQLKQKQEITHPTEQEDIDSLIQRVSALSTSIEKETNALQNFREEVNSELKNAEIAGRKLSTSAAHENIYLPSPYHWEKLNAFTRRMTRLKEQIEEIDEIISHSEQKKGSSTRPEKLHATLRAQYETLVRLTAKISYLHNLTANLREQFIRLKGNDVKQLFKEEDQKKWVPFEARERTTVSSVSEDKKNTQKPAPTFGFDTGTTGFGNIFGSSSSSGFDSSFGTFGTGNFGFGADTTSFGASTSTSSRTTASRKGSKKNRGK